MRSFAIEILNISNKQDTRDGRHRINLCRFFRRIRRAKTAHLDRGKTWKFIDDAGIPMREIYKQMIPKWPSSLDLPPKEVPTRIEK
jgi:hypothetical protein